MAASISANPNPVLIPWWQGSTNASISWDTGSNQPGRVYLSIDGAAPKFFDGTPEPPAVTPKPTKGTKKQRVILGSTYDFQLKLTTPLATVLATLRIKGEEKLGLTAGLGAIVKNTVPASQHIFGLQVTVGVDSVAIRFNTRQDVFATVEIKNEVRQETVFALIRGTNRVYDFVTRDPLEQGVLHSYKIIAPSLPGSLIPGDKTATGQFFTGTRTAQVFFNSLFMRHAGDTGWDEDGEFTFYFGAGDVDSKTNLGNVESIPQTDIDTGDTVGLGKVVTILSAPERLWVQVTADASYDFVALTGLSVGAPGFAPEGSTCREYDDEDGWYATVTQHFDFSDLEDGTRDQPFVLANGGCGISFLVDGHVLVEAHPGAPVQPFIKPSPPRSPVPRVAILRNVGEKAIVGTGAGLAQAVRLVPGGAAYVKTISRNPATPSARWTRIGGEVAGPLTVLASSEDRVSLFAVGRDGAVAHKTLSRDIPATDKWETLGGAFVGPIAAAAGADDRIDIFGLGADGRVLHRTLSAAMGRQAAGDWQLIGEDVGGSLNAFSSPRGVSVVAVSRKGEVLHKLLRDGEWRPAGREWQSLGSAPTGSLSAELVEDDIAVLAVLAENETIHLLPWRNYPETPRGDGWQKVGTINSLLDARFSLIEAPVAVDRACPAAPAASSQSTTNPQPGS